MIQKQKRKHRHGLFITAIAIILLGVLVTPLFTVNNAEAVNVSNLTIGRHETSVDVTWTVTGLAGTSYGYAVTAIPIEGGSEIIIVTVSSGETDTTKTVIGDTGQLAKGTSYTLKVVITDDVSGTTVTKTTTFSTTGATGIAAIQAVFWNAYAALVAIVWLLCIGVAAYYLAKRAKEEDDRLRGKQLQYAIEAIVTGVVISILPLIAAMAQGWIQI